MSTPCSPFFTTRVLGPMARMARAALTMFHSPESCRASAFVTFTSSGGGSVQKTLASGNTGYTIDLSTLSDGTVTESMLITDAAGNTKTVTGTLVSGTTLKLDT